MKRKLLDFEKRPGFGAIVLILSLSAVLAILCVDRVDRPNLDLRIERHNQILSGTALSPYRYRVLVPFVCDIITKALSAVFPFKVAFLLAYSIYDLLSIFFVLASLYFWLRAWFDSEPAIIGVLFVAATMPLALQDHDFQPWSFLEAGLFSASLLAIHRKRYWLLALLMALAALNRETAIFIPLAFLATMDLKQVFKTSKVTNWRPIVVFGVLCLIWGAIFLALRYFLGSAPQIHTVAELLAWNTSKDVFLRTIVNVSLFFGGFWVLALFGWRYAPSFVKRVSLVIPFYMATIIVWGIWFEVRLLMPLYPVIVALGLSFLYLRDQRAVGA